MSDLLGRLKDAEAKLAEVQAFLTDLRKAGTPLEQVTVEYAEETGLQKAEAFYDYIRGDEGELFPRMSEAQFEGIEIDLKWGAGILPLSWMAYCLATDYHETGKTMQGVREGFTVSDAWRRKNLRYYPWYGRGKVQLTWERNYQKANERLCQLGLSCNLIANPDEALELDKAAAILILGMKEGWFTGKSLRDYLPAVPTRQHYVNARRIVNGTDRAELIAGYAVEFEKALRLGEWK